MRNIVFFFLLVYGSCLFTSCAEEAVTIKIGVISDVHYLSEQLMDDGWAIQNYDRNSSKVVREVPAILQQVLNDYLDSDINILFISGDMTKDGEEQSHIDFVGKLKPLMDKGVRVFVVPGNHDINVPNPLKYEGDKTTPVKNVTPEEFAKIYAGCGYGDALKRDANSLSYVAELNPSTWLLAIDSNRYREYTNNTISGGKISAGTEQWITETLNEAKDENIQVIGMMHHGLVEHIMMQDTFFGEYIVEDWKRLAPKFADLGMKAVFTGHFHANDITEYISSAGNKIYDIETGSLVAYAFPYRFVELGKNGMKITTKNIESTPDAPRLAEQNKIVMEETAKRLAESKLRARGMSFPPETTRLITDIIAKVFVKHLEGDEVVDQELEQLIQQLGKELDSPIDLTQLSKLDFEPADNNVEISF